MRRLVLLIFLPSLFGLHILFGAVLQFTMRDEYPGLREAVQRHAPPRPKMISLTADLDIGHPLVRRLGGSWVGQPHTLWLMYSAQMLLEAGRDDPAKLSAYIERDVRMFADNVRNGAPDVILVGFDEHSKQMLTHPEIAAVMQDYESVARASDVTVWVPRRRASPAQ